jgi:hypothetical protein
MKKVTVLELVFAILNDLRVRISPRKPALFGGELQGFLAVELGLVHELLDARGKGLSGVGVRAGFGGIGGADQQGDFAAGGVLFK